MVLLIAKPLTIILTTLYEKTKKTIQANGQNEEYNSLNLNRYINKESDNKGKTTMKDKDTKKNIAQ